MISEESKKQLLTFYRDRHKTALYIARKSKRSDDRAMWQKEAAYFRQQIERIKRY